MPLFMPLFVCLSAIVIFAVLFYKRWFLRNPEIVVKNDGWVVSPANGKVLKIIRYAEQEEITIRKGSRNLKTMTGAVAKSGYIVIIVMNVFNVHYQKAPLAGKIISIKYRRGKFLNAVFGAANLKAAAENECNEILMETQKGRMRIIQIAGIIARRIVCFVKAGQMVQKGEDLGLIKLGSQVVLILPEIDLFIKEGDKVRAGVTVIA